jgi:hypothetical protein
MSQLLCIVETGVVWAALMLLSGGISFGVQAFFWKPPSDRPSLGAGEIVGAEVKRTVLRYSLMTVSALPITIAFVFALLHLWNVLLIVGAVLIIASQVPDVLWQIHNPEMVTRPARERPLWVLAKIVCLGSLPLIWYGLCR